MNALQTDFHYYRVDDDRSPRRKANDFETKILSSLVLQVNVFFKIPRIVRLVAISMQPQPQESTNQDVDLNSVAVSEEEIAAAQRLLAVVPQVDLVEGLVPEAQVVKTPDPSPDAPSFNRPVRIHIRAERIYSLCTFAAHLGPGYESNPTYRRGFSWGFCVLIREVMHHVCEMAFVEAWQKEFPPRLRSANYPQVEIWSGPPTPPRYSSSVYLPSGLPPTTPRRSLAHESPLFSPRLKGEAGFWLEEKLFGGAYLVAQDSNVIPQHPLIEVPEDLKLCRISHIHAKTVYKKGYKIWTIDDDMFQLVGPFTDGDLLRGNGNDFSSKHGVEHEASTVGSSAFGSSVVGSATRDVFFADEDDEDVQKYVGWMRRLWKEGEA
ncbi:hypothetical protein GGX14DRAFT_555938 [Mycena pura]|uniref:Uncharacterized protein n=1 Tax=Mycena pura TaxID=153505 RepID=A0AAD7E420_9AGAR|nr:hypothetical protein GGX14DRAFT_555938 [Mycena pura]